MATQEISTLLRIPRSQLDAAFAPESTLYGHYLDLRVEMDKAVEGKAVVSDYVEVRVVRMVRYESS